MQYEYTPTPLSESTTNASAMMGSPTTDGSQTQSSNNSSSGSFLDSLVKGAANIGSKIVQGAAKTAPLAAEEELAGGGPEDPVADVAAIGTEAAGIGSEFLK